MPLKSGSKKATKPCEDVLRGLAGRDADCTDSQRGKYCAKVSGPLLDRIDIQIEVPGVNFQEMVTKADGESSAAIRERVARARVYQLLRFRGRRIYANAQMGPKDVKQFCRIDRDGEKLLEAGTLAGSKGIII